MPLDASPEDGVSWLTVGEEQGAGHHFLEDVAIEALNCGLEVHVGTCPQIAKPLPLVAFLGCSEVEHEFGHIADGVGGGRKVFHLEGVLKGEIEVGKGVGSGVLKRVLHAAHVDISCIGEGVGIVGFSIRPAVEIHKALHLVVEQVKVVLEVKRLPLAVQPQLVRVHFLRVEFASSGEDGNLRSAVEERGIDEGVCVGALETDDRIRQPDERHTG